MSDEEKNVEKKGKAFLNEFKEFISRGNIMDMAVGIIVGSAFTSIVTSLVDDILTPIIGLIMGGLDFSSIGVNVMDATISVGLFLQAVINFLIVSFVIFCLVKTMNKIQRKKEEPAPEPEKPDPQIELLTEIRDLLKEQEQQTK